MSVCKLGAVPITPNALLLSERVAIVTGGAQGIGEAVALAFAALGAHVAVCDNNPPGVEATGRAITALGRRTVVGVLDVRDREAVEDFVGRVARELGAIDVLVNNAGGGFQADFVDVSEKGEAALIAENYTSVTSFVRATAPHMPDRGGSIINVTSIEAHRAAPGFATYAAMKAAVANLTRSLALELGERRIRVNCLAPDVIPTPGIGEPPVRTPLPVAGHVEDVAAGAVYLAGELSRFVTGTTLHIDGGNHAAAGWHRGPDGRFEP
jgi:NAD(P)-dependent dehydrogenase (short-subunit alcohol dehydrogenase family)